MPSRPDEPGQAAVGAGGRPSPRAFASATGFVFQIVGMVYILGGCCLWSLAGRFIDRPEPARSWWAADGAANQLEGDEPVREASDAVQLASAAAVIGTFIGGLALLAFGIGIQAERLSSARWGTASAASLAAVWIVVVGAWIYSARDWAGGLWGIVMTVANVVLALLAAESSRVLRGHPPEPDAPLDAAFVAQFEQRRNLPPD